MQVEKKLTPDELLRYVQAEEASASCGRLKVFLGYASGVGKSYRMFDEGRRRRERGQDVVVGAIQPRNSPEIVGLLQHLEILPLRYVDGVATVDVPALVRRHPQVCLIDGLAHDNPPAACTAHRWQDVELLLQAGISVVTTINLEFVAERQHQVEQIRGRRACANVPESFLRKADEFVLVDAPANFTSSGVKENYVDDAALASKEKKLSQLREIALLLAADVVDSQLETYLRGQGVETSWGTQERLLVCLTPKSDAARMIARASLVSKRFHGTLFAIHVRNKPITPDEEAALQRNLQIAREAGVELVLLESDDEVEAIIEFARKERITQLYIGQSSVRDWRMRLTGTVADRLIKAAEGIDVKLFPQ